MSSRRPEASEQTFSIFAGFYFVVDVKKVAFITIFFFSIVPRRSEDWPKRLRLEEQEEMGSEVNFQQNGHASNLPGCE